MESSLFPIMGMITWIFWELSLASKENRLIAVSREVHNFILTSLHSIPGKKIFNCTDCTGKKWVSSAEGSQENICI